jgi:hypothetical protein
VVAKIERKTQAWTCDAAGCKEAAETETDAFPPFGWARMQADFWHTGTTAEPTWSTSLTKHVSCGGEALGSAYAKLQIRSVDLCPEHARTLIVAFEPVAKLTDR